jgi:SNF2 family DNA or RNA helicase
MTLPPLWSHQKTGIERARSAKHFAFFYDPGTGKSRTAIEIMKEEFNATSRIQRTLIVAPAVVCPNWKDEWLLYSKIEAGRVKVLDGSGEKRLKEFKKLAYTFPESQEGRKGQVFITNYEVFSRMPDLVAQIRHWGPEFCVWDESHKLKNPDAKSSKAAAELSGKVARNLILTGSPILNNALDIFQQVKVMMGGFPTERFFQTMDTRELITNFFGFRARYFVDRNKGMPSHKYYPDWQIMTKEKDGIDAAKEISDILSRIGMVAKKEECLDLPPELVQVVKVGMTKEQSIAYREMELNFMAEFATGVSVAQIAMTKGMRLQQITSGFVPLTGQDPEDEFAASKVRFEKTPKQEALRELLETLVPRSKVLIWAVWKENYVQIRQVLEDLRIEYVEVHGDVPDGKKKEAIKRFQSDDRVRVYLGHPGSGGIGVNLVQAGYSIRYSRTFSLEHLIQSRARNYRGGTKEQGHESITHYELVCENTIEEVAVARLNGKEEISAKILSSLAKDLVLLRKSAKKDS